MSHGARSLYVALRARYNNKLQNAVYLSIRTAQKELGSFSRKDNIGRWFHELQYYGFVVMESGACLGVEGRPIGGDGTKQFIGLDGQHRNVACVMLRQRTRSIARSRDFNRPISYGRSWRGV